MIAPAPQPTLGSDALGTRLQASLAVDLPASSDFDLNPLIPAADRGRRDLRQAAVLVAVVGPAARPTVLLTKRSARLTHHPGQIAFPGGKLDAGDADHAAAALREAGEEVGLAPAAVEVLGALPPHETVTGFSVVPILARVAAPFRPVPEADEVAEAFFVPFDHLADPTRYRIEWRRWRGERRHYYTVPWGPYYIWGATARILRGLAERLTHCP